MMLPFHSDTHLPFLPRPSSHCREKLKQVNPRFFSLFSPFVVVFLSSLSPSSTLGHLSVFICLPFSLSPISLLPLSWSLHGSGWESRHALGCIPPPTIRHSSHPTNDSCLYPLTLSPLYFSRKTMCCGYISMPVL